MKVKIGISESDRMRIVDGLSALLANSYTLYLKIHNFHWNVEGPMFNTLHVMFMEQYTELWNALDLIAERIRALGAYAPGSHKKYAKLSIIKESDENLSAEDMVKEALEGHETIAKIIREMFQNAEDAKDQVTMDLFTGRLQIHEKTAWMLRSLLRK